uniref:NADP-dependent oxidoreductase domain-containing protein n=1 Tax=Setaria digitata TaxID=48799 RepID=A0A915PNF7_9BILA
MNSGKETKKENRTKCFDCLSRDRAILLRNHWLFCALVILTEAQMLKEKMERKQNLLMASIQSVEEDETSVNVTFFNFSTPANSSMVPLYLIADHLSKYHKGYKENVFKDRSSVKDVESEDNKDSRKRENRGTSVNLNITGRYHIPSIGLGTWLAQPGQVGNAVRVALSNGYRHIDCAHVYRNQVEVGEGLAERADVFITSKIWNTFHSYEMSKKAVDIILNELRLDYLDLCLIHWPQGYEESGEFFPKRPDGEKFKYSNVDYLDTWRALEECVKMGKVRSLGLSNFNHKQILRVISNGTIKPAVLQVELHPYFQQRKLHDFCEEHGIVVTAYSPLANPSTPFRKEGDAVLLNDPIILKLAEVHHKSAAQIALRWGVQRGLVVIPKSVTEKRIVENINIFDFELKSEEMALIDTLDKNWRILDLARDSDHPFFPFNEKY